MTEVSTDSSALDLAIYRYQNPFSNMSAPKGVYVPLQNPSDIRLLSLQPGKPDDPIECFLSNPMNLDSLDSPEEIAGRKIGHLRTYVALSYVWGDQNDKRRIFVNWQPFWVTYNLFSLLSRVRNFFMDMRCLWVDAIWFVHFPLILITVSRKV